MTGISPHDLASKVGTDIGTSEWITVDQEMINKVRRRDRRPPVHPY